MHRKGAELSFWATVSSFLASLEKISNCVFSRFVIFPTIQSEFTDVISELETSAFHWKQSHSDRQPIANVKCFRM